MLSSLNCCVIFLLDLAATLSQWSISVSSLLASEIRSQMVLVSMSRLVAFFSKFGGEGRFFLVAVYSYSENIRGSFI